MIRARALHLGLAAGVLALLAAAAAASMALLYASEERAATDRVDRTLDIEVEELLRLHRDVGTGALHAELERRILASPDTLYLLGAPGGTPDVGSVARWPEELLDGGAGAAPALTEETHVMVRGPDGVLLGRRLRAVSRPLSDGRSLVVAHDATGHEASMRRLRAALFAAGAIVVFAGVGVGLAVGVVLLRRIRTMNRTIVAILAGERARRVPVSRAGNEFDRLASQFNRLLDENDALVANMRAVTDEIAHDLRTPLSRVRQRLETCVDERADGDADLRAATVGAAIRDLDGVLATFEAVLTLSRLESGAGRELLRRTDLRFLRDVADLHEPRADEFGVPLEVDVDDDAAVMAEPNLLGQAVSNLIDNALKYAATGGLVRVVAAREGDRVAITVADRGPGIPEADRERVLRRFARLDAARGRAGAGLGLAFVKAVADLHGAALSLADGDPGLVVTLRLPAA